jgi:hypothetical protein
MRGGFTFSANRIVLLQNPTPAGPVLGYYAGEPIASAVVDEFGRRYLYAGVGPRRRDGRVDEQALRPGEWLTESGLIYQRDAERRRRH